MMFVGAILDRGPYVSEVGLVSDTVIHAVRGALHGGKRGNIERSGGVNQD